MSKAIDNLIICSPYHEPARHWDYDRQNEIHIIKEHRRPAGFFVATDTKHMADDPGKFVPIELVNDIRGRVARWREAGYHGATPQTKDLLRHWRDEGFNKERRFYFCQLEAMETLIWLSEARGQDRDDVVIPGDGGMFPRLCSKMGTGTGKTIVMAMLMAWQIVNKVSKPEDNRFSSHIFIVAPGLTVRNRLSVLLPSNKGNYFDAYHIVPSKHRKKLSRGVIAIRNWHALNYDTNEKLRKRRGVDKRGAKSDEAFTRDVLGDTPKSQSVLVINDEAHHAWRMSTKHGSGSLADDANIATIWVNGLDKIHRARNILTCYDFTATPFVPSGKKNASENLFEWVVSDFGLNDAIESGLVKTPRIVVSDGGKLDPKTLKPRLFHIYNNEDVKRNLSSKASPDQELPQLVHSAYISLGMDWLATKKKWRKSGVKVPPVMITVANSTETAARIEYAFHSKAILPTELCEESQFLRIDSRKLEMAEYVAGTNGQNGTTKRRKDSEAAEFLRKQINTVGKIGEPGEQIQNVVSVEMLSEGWDAKTVTHIMGLRKFGSQLLCEQVVGRGLRRSSHKLDKETGMYKPEYVNVYGIPFTFLPHEDGGTTPAPMPQTSIDIMVLSEKIHHQLTWPNVLRIETVFRDKLSINMDKLPNLVLDQAETPTDIELAPVIAEKAKKDGKFSIDLIDLSNELSKDLRLQTLIFRCAEKKFKSMKPRGWKSCDVYLMSGLVNMAERFINSGKIVFKPADIDENDARIRVLIGLNTSKVFEHFSNAINLENIAESHLILDVDRPVISTSDVIGWSTTNPHIHKAKKSHLSHADCDLSWEMAVADTLDRSKFVHSWIKNGRQVGFAIPYTHAGATPNYYPDFLLRLMSGNMLVIEVKGEEKDIDKSKYSAMNQWIDAVNKEGKHGNWSFVVVYDPSDVHDVLFKYSDDNS